MIIIISHSYHMARDWARMGRLPLLSYYIVCNEADCQQLLGIEIKPNDTIARVGHEPSKNQYIEDFIKSRIR